MSKKNQIVKVLVSPRELREWRKHAQIEAEGSMSRYVRAVVNAAIAATAIAIVVGCGAPASTAVDSNTVDATNADAYPKISRIATWGDSLTYAADSFLWIPYPEQLTQMTGIPVYNGGGSGLTSTQILARFTFFDVLHDWPSVIWSGRNNFSDRQTVARDIAAMVAMLKNPNYIVMSVINADVPQERKGGVDYDSIIALNASLALTYGDKYLDIRSLLVEAYDPSIASEVINHDQDVPPTSLRYAGGPHLSTAGFGFVAKQVARKYGLQP